MVWHLRQAPVEPLTCPCQASIKLQCVVLGKPNVPTSQRQQYKAGRVADVSPQRVRLHD